MRILEHVNPGSLFADVHALFAAQEAEHNLLLGVLKAVSEGRYAAIVPLVWAVHDEGGALVGAAVRTAPSPLLVSRMPVRAIDALADRMLDQALLPCRVMGIESVVERLCARLREVSGIETARVAHMRLFALESVVPPRRTEGRMRHATPEDRTRVGEFFRAFHAEAVPHEPAPTDPDRLAASAIANESAFMWELRHEPVCLAIYGREVGGGASIGPVYTPPAQRGHGYASALVGALSQHLLETGRRYTCLFADLNNPTSNRVYARLGYQPVSDFAQWDISRGNKVDISRGGEAMEHRSAGC